MFGLIIRGVFLVGIVGWYSASLWRMIDGYWRDQFQRYLDDEYQRNPNMRKDVLEHADKQPEPGIAEAAGKTGITVTDFNENAGAADSSAGPREENASTPPAAVDDSNAGAATPVVVGAAAAAGRKAEEEEEETGKKKKEVARPVDAGGGGSGTETEPAFQADRGRDTENHQIRMMQLGYDDSGESQTVEEKNKKKQVQQKEQSEKRQQQKQRGGAGQKKEKKSPVRKKRKPSKKPKIGAKTEEESKRARKKNVIFTDEDFEAAQRVQKYSNRDFEEFDEDHEERLRDEEDEPGIRVADLPFKPVIDIYDLDKISREEYCPLTLDEDPGCGDTRTWP